MTSRWCDDCHFCGCDHQEWEEFVRSHIDRQLIDSCTFAALVARQYADISRTRLESILNSFNRESAQEHSHFENDSIRYVYLPVDTDLYCVLITDLASNLVWDLETVKMCAKLVSEAVNSESSAATNSDDESMDYPTSIAPSTVRATASNVNDAALMIVHYWDELLTSIPPSASGGVCSALFAPHSFQTSVPAGGAREQVTTSLIRQQIEMHSHEEKLSKIITEVRFCMNLNFASCSFPAFFNGRAKLATHAKRPSVVQSKSIVKSLRNDWLHRSEEAAETISAHSHRVAPNRIHLNHRRLLNLHPRTRCQLPLHQLHLHPSQH